MFRFTQEQSSGSQNQCLATITGMVLARHWLWLPDDGSCVNRNTSEQLLYFNVFLITYNLYNWVRQLDNNLFDIIVNMAHLLTNKLYYL